MVSFERRINGAMAGGVVAVAALCAPWAGLSQPPNDAAADAQAQLVEQIELEERQNGQLSDGLVDPLTSLSLLFQESGDHTLAIAALERALQLVRVNRGLRAFDQARLLRLLIRNEQARGNIAAAWKREQELLALAKRHPDELETVSIFREVGDRRIALLDRYLTGEAAQEVVLGCYYALLSIGESSCTSGEKHVVVQGILTDAWNNYLDAIEVYQRHGLYASDELHELEMELLQSSYVYGNYGLGKESLQRLRDYHIANAEPLATQFEALLRLADWDLLFGRIATAHQQYLQAYHLLDDDGTAHTARLFSPEQPIALPAFLQSPLASNAEDSTGFIDVAFDITWHGNAKRVEILDAPPNTPNEVKKELVNRIGQMRFRPNIVAGEIPPSSRVVARYHLSPQRETVEDPQEEARQRTIRHYRADMGLPRQIIESLPPVNGTTD